VLKSWMGKYGDSIFGGGLGDWCRGLRAEVDARLRTAQSPLHVFFFAQ
jgi:hypothetical protein